MSHNGTKNRKCGSGFCAAWSLIFFLGAAGAIAQQAPASRAQAAAFVTLADALRELADTGETALAVGADKNYYAAKPPPGSRVAEIALAFGLLTRRYGGVTAIAPATMTVLNANLGVPSIYLNIPAREAFTLLAANMTDAQRQMLTSERGIGIADMENDLQRGLFMALIPGDSLPYRPRFLSGQPDGSGENAGGGTLQNPLQNGRLRVGMKMNMVVHSPGHETMGFVPSMRAPKGPPLYDVANQDHLFRQDTVDGVTVRSVVANTLKKSQLNYDLPALQTTISLQGLNTVGDLTARIGEKTHMELYADRHYEAKKLTVTGASHGALASDLLRALAVCVTGTYRRVGPAYVLTDDVIGVGMRRAQIAEFQSDADAQRQKPIEEAEAKLQQRQALWKRPLSAFGDPLAPSPEQMAMKDENVLGGGAFRTLKINFDQLTPVQKDALKRYSEASIHNNPDHSGAGIDFDRDMQMTLIPSVQLLVPGVDGPIDTDIGQWVSDNFRDMANWKQRPAPKPAPLTGKANAPEENLPPMAGLVNAIPRRALLTSCRTADDVNNAVTKMKRMGLNELWLAVFTNGTSRINGTPFPMLAPNSPDLLNYALKITQGTGIALYPVIDMFQWGTDVPHDQMDFTILGETSVQYAQRVHKRNVLIAAANGSDPPGQPSSRLTASVFAPEAMARLKGLVSALAQRPGIAGIVWRETDPEGYAETDSRNSMRAAGNGQLGYTTEARLAFLRSHHADPLDVERTSQGRGLEQRANTSLPLFDDWGIGTTLEREWNRFRAETNQQGLGALYAAANPQNDTSQPHAVRLENGPLKAATAKPIVFVRERRASWGTTWYGLWSGPETPLPTHHYDFEEANASGDLQRAPEEFQQARKQGKINLVRLPFWGDLDEVALVRQWQIAFKDVAQNKKWEGFVLEMMEP